MQVEGSPHDSPLAPLTGRASVFRKRTDLARVVSAECPVPMFVLEGAGHAASAPPGQKRHCQLESSSYSLPWRATPRSSVSPWWPDLGSLGRIASAEV